MENRTVFLYYSEKERKRKRKKERRGIRKSPPSDPMTILDFLWVV